jgi:hypothetical protein
LTVIARDAIAHLAESNEHEEIVPMVTVLASAVRLLTQYFPRIPREITGGLLRFVDKVPEPSRTFLTALLAESVDTAQLRALATINIRSSADWSQALTPATIIARKALSQACISGDVELFWTACLILCQPGLGVRIRERASANQHADPVAATKWLAKQISAGTEQPLEAVLVQRALSNASARAVGELLFDLPLADFRTLILPDETVVLLASDDGNQLYCCELRRDKISAPHRVAEGDWRNDRIAEWRKEYPSQYGYAIEIYFGHLRQPHPSPIAASVSGLHPIRSVTGRIVTLVAEGRLFGYAHRLANDVAGNPASVVVAPSARWLGAIRQTPGKAVQPAAAWLGSPKSKNGTLVCLRRELGPILEAQKLPLLDDDTLPDLTDRSFVILGSHGNALNSTGFSRVSDDENEYEPDRVAAALAGTSCVVLFVCHSGRGDERLYSHETTGLVSSLLRHEVRAVVAPLWPLDVSLAVAWLEEFGKTDREGTLVERVDEAQHAMAKRPAFAEAFGEHPLVRNTFTVFGDGAERLAAAS